MIYQITEAQRQQLLIVLNEACIYDDGEAKWDRRGNAEKMLLSRTPVSDEPVAYVSKADINEIVWVANDNRIGRGDPLYRHPAPLSDEPVATQTERECLIAFAVENSQRPNSMGDKLLFKAIAAMLEADGKALTMLQSLAPVGEVDLIAERDTLNDDLEIARDRWGQ
jgi:hypothetical protein